MAGNDDQRSDETDGPGTPHSGHDADDAAAAGTPDESRELFAVDSGGDATHFEIVETEIFAVDAAGEVVDITESVEVVEHDWPRDSNDVPADDTAGPRDDTTQPRDDTTGSAGETVQPDTVQPADDPTQPQRDSAESQHEGQESESDTDPSWRMPAETARQDRVWMAFPPSGGYLGVDAALDESRRAWSEVAHAILPFEPVTMVVDPHDFGAARRYLAGEIDIVIAPLDDAWMRDIGPTFVFDDETGRVGAVTWRFNGWGAQEWARWDNDSVIGGIVAARSGARRVLSPLVNEGGGIHVDGLGTVLLTESVQLDQHRNPGWSAADVEAELARTIGATNPVWLKRGLYRDAKRFGTRGHVDILATIPSPGRMLVHVQLDPAHPDHEITREILETLRASRTPDGSEWDIVELPAPQVLRDGEDFVDYSYVNHLVVNDAVIACMFDDPNDEQARHILAQAYPGREVVGVDARPLFALGGGIHCITQQQPAPRAEGTRA